MDSQLRRLLNHKVMWRPYLSEDVAGKEDHGDPVELPCYIAEEDRVVRNEAGVQVISEGAIYLDAEDPDELVRESVAVMTSRDEITLPDGTKPLILRRRRYYNEKGPLSFVVLLI